MASADGRAGLAELDAGDAAEYHSDRMSKRLVVNHEWLRGAWEWRYHWHDGREFKLDRPVRYRTREDCLVGRDPIPTFIEVEEPATPATSEAQEPSGPTEPAVVGES